MKGHGSDTKNKSVSKWYEEFPKAEVPYKHAKSDFEVLNLKDEGKKYLNADTSAFQLKQSHSKNSEIMWLKTALTRGTTSDKVAAAVVLIQDNPKYNLVQLTSLISQVKAAKHNQCNMIITALKDLFLSDLLHPKYKLLKFEEQDLDKIENLETSDQINKIDGSRKKLLAHWCFEDQLREQYENFVLSLANIASDTVETNRERAISVMTDLLIGNSEQEHKLLELIVNKIGDPHCKVGSKAVFCLQKLLYEHSNMKFVILKEVEKLLFRKNVGQRAQYYAICLLTQFVLTKADDEVATSLIEVYFAFFKACLKKGEPDSRMMAAILTGVSRAYHFAKIDSDLLRDHIDSVYKVIHIGSFNVSLNALNLLYHVEGTSKDQSNRFYSAFYRKLLDPQIGIANKRAVFLNLLYRVLQNDQSLLRLYAFIKRILQITLYFPANMACATLYVISKVLQSRKDLKHFLLHSQNSIKIENNFSNAKENDSSKNKEIINIDENEPTVSPEMDSNIMMNVTIDTTVNLPKQDIDEKQDIDADTKDFTQKPYNPFCRNPLYANAMKSLHAELVSLSKHFHPSVSLFANLIIQEKTINYTGDPLEDLTLIRFLDRYVFKNPKKLESKKVQKKNDPLAQRSGYLPKGIRSLPVDSIAYLNEAEERIPVDELFLYRYLKRKNESTNVYNEKDSDNESVNSEEFNEMLDKFSTNENLDDLDIAAAIGTIKNKKDDEIDDFENSEHMEDEENDVNSSTESEDIDEGSDNSLDDIDDSDIADIEDEDLSDIYFSEGSDNNDDDLSGVMLNIKNKHNKGNDPIRQHKVKKNNKKNLNDIFVSAEKFSQMLEEQSRTKNKHGSTNALNTMDGATSKQIDWETKRNQKLTRSFDRKKRKHVKILNNKNNKKIKR
ncbi:CCAAT/enhancer-binding protein zeta [Vespa velutina]|uniref:CCAAT/enhancer-binding protein zeta n=1 Tax=Vespa velutina TaxID=202808 RepID=UPI001FB42974|nr:CCAAT/enhancer-binding protein zeta [Vespa velutina]